MRPRRLALGLLALAALLAAAFGVPRLVPGAVDALRPGPFTGGAGSRARWVATVAGWPAALAADDAGAVVIAGRGEVRALLASGGETAWRATVAGASLHPPALGDDLVVLSAGDAVVTLDRATGERRWQRPTPGPAGPVTLAGATVVAGTDDGHLVAYATADGEPRWSVAYPGAVRAPPAADLGAALAVAAWHGGEVPAVRAVDLATGETRWEAPMEPFAAAPVVHAGLVLVAEGDGAGSARVVARVLETGEVVGAVPMPAGFESSIEPAAADGDLTVVDHLGTVTLLDAASGRVRWRTGLDRAVLRTRVLVTPGAVLLTTHRGDIVVLDRSTGRLRDVWEPGGFPVGLARSGGDLLVALRLTEPGRVEAHALP